MRPFTRRLAEHARAGRAVQSAVIAGALSQLRSLTVSDRLTACLISHLARASARKRAHRPAETNIETITQRRTRAMTRPPDYTPAPDSYEHQRPTTAAMTAEERAAIRKAGAETRGAPENGRDYRNGSKTPQWSQCSRCSCEQHPHPRRICSYRYVCIRGTMSQNMP